MSTDTEDGRKKMTDERILNFVQNHEEPCVTAGEIADELGVTNEAVNYRLYKLEEDGEVRGKEVGASAKIWYITG